MKTEELRERLMGVMDETTALLSAPLIPTKVSESLVPAVEEWWRKANATVDSIMRMYYLAKNKLDRVEEIPDLTSDIEIREIVDLIEDMEVKVKQLKQSREEILKLIEKDMEYRVKLNFNEPSLFRTVRE